MRSSWKCDFITNDIVRVFCDLNVKKKNYIKCRNRRIKLFAGLVGKKLCVYNGRKYMNVLIRHCMVGKYLGSFLLTRRFSSTIHNKKKRDNKK